MNKRQKEVARVQLEDEEAVVKEIEKAYKKALTDINAKIRALQTDELTQSRIYQLQYQKALKSQINGILERMRDEQYTSIEQYLKDCYEKGYLGVMYDLQGQGIPLIIPIDQTQVVNAVVNDVPLSESMYDHMGKTVSTLKKRVNAELSRGLSQAYSWTKIARNIENVSKIGYSNAVRIARTEGHRIQNQSAMDAMKKVQDRGVKIMKQWISTLDRKTRPDHQKLDGQVREIDEPFEVNGHKGMHPGAFGVAKEDINCRCRMVQTMERDMDEEELETLKERAKYFGVDKSKDFEDFRKKWIDRSNAFNDKGELKTASEIKSHMSNITKGTEKQIAWAKDLRKEYMEMIDDHVLGYGRKRYTPEMIALNVQVLETLCSIKSAKFWIDKRGFRLNGYSFVWVELQSFIEEGELDQYLSLKGYKI